MNNRVTILSEVTNEIEALHRFFVAWFSGHAPDSEEYLTSEFSVRFSQSFYIIQPGGATMEKSGLVNVIRGGYGSNPDFRIAIRNVTLRYELNGHVLVTYEEWQRNAKVSKPSDNGRLATVLFRCDGAKLQWLHVHETWLPHDIMVAGPFDF